MWSPLWSILASKILQFWAKGTDSDNPSYFSRKETKTPCFAPEGSQKNVSAHGLLLFVNFTINNCKVSQQMPTIHIFENNSTHPVPVFVVP